MRNLRCELRSSYARDPLVIKGFLFSPKYLDDFLIVLSSISFVTSSESISLPSPLDSNLW